jgi:hypothetical protein
MGGGGGVFKEKSKILKLAGVLKRNSLLTLSVAASEVTEIFSYRTSYAVSSTTT